MSSHELDGARALDCFLEGAQYFLRQQVVAGSREPVWTSPKEGTMVAIMRIPHANQSDPDRPATCRISCRRPGADPNTSGCDCRSGSAKPHGDSSAPSIERRKRSARATLMR